MSDTLDPKRDLMISALYGELSPEEMDRFRRILDEDPQLRAEWEELQQTRTLLQEGSAEDRIPDPFVEDAPWIRSQDPGGEAARGLEPVRESVQMIGGRGRTSGNGRGRWFSGLRWLLAPAAGFALATAVFLVLAFSGLRVDRLERGFAVHFGPPPAGTEMHRNQPLASGSGLGGDPAASLPGTGSMGMPAASNRGMEFTGGMEVSGTPSQTASPGSPLRLASGEGPYMTRQEFAAFATYLMESTEDRLQTESMRREGELILRLQDLTRYVERRQIQERRELEDQIDQVWMGVIGLETMENRSGVSPVYTDEPLDWNPDQKGRNGEKEDSND